MIDEMKCTDEKEKCCTDEKATSCTETVKVVTDECKKDDCCGTPDACTKEDEKTAA